MVAVMKLHRQRVIAVATGIFLLVIVSVIFINVTTLQLDIQRRWNSSNRSVYECVYSDERPGERIGARILLLAYMRSGSTYTSELLALDPQVNFIFEPFFLFRYARINWDNAEDAKSMSSLMENLYHCDPLLTSYVTSSRFVQRIRFDETNCRDRPLLIKTIRLHGKVLPQLIKNVPQLKVVHLVRDPRAIFSSRNKVKTKWEADEICRQIRADVKMMNLMKYQNPDRWSDRYTMVRYEDLADKQRINASLTALYNFLQTPLNNSLLDEYQRRHYTSRRRGKSFNTVRDVDFDPNHWQFTMSAEDIDAIQQECSDIMQLFGYETFQTTSGTKLSTINVTEKN